MDVVVDFTEPLLNFFVRPAFDWSPEIHPDDLSKDSGVDLFLVLRDI